MTPTPDMIRAARLAAGLTQTEAAALVHRSRAASWSEWERGAVPMPAAEWDLFGLKVAMMGPPAEVRHVDGAGRVRRSNKVVDTKSNNK